MGAKLVVGIDPGTRTCGVATWDKEQRKIVHMKTMRFHAMLLYLFNLQGNQVSIRFEDARQRKWFGTAKGSSEDDAKKQGVGAVKALCTVLEDFCEDIGFQYIAVKPAAHTTKWSKVYLKQISGYDGPSSEHSRDAAALVVGL